MIEDDRSVSWKAYVDRRFEDSDKAIQAALRSAELAVNKANEASDKRFEGMNEFRAALSDQQRDLMTRKEYDATYSNLSKRMSDLEAWRYESGGSGRAAEQAWTRTMAAASILIALGIALYTVFSRH